MKKILCPNSKNWYYLIFSEDWKHHIRAGDFPKARLIPCNARCAEPCSFPRFGKHDCIICCGRGLHLHPPLKRVGFFWFFFWLFDFGLNSDMKKIRFKKLYSLKSYSAFALFVTISSGTLKK